MTKISETNARAAADSRRAARAARNEADISARWTGALQRAGIGAPAPARAARGSIPQRWDAAMRRAGVIV